MANAFGPYDQIYYAQEALAVLYKSLGFARRVYRRLDAQAQQIHQTIYFRRPGTFTATNMPGTTATETLPDTVTCTISNWMGSGISLNDKELSYGKERIFAEHVAPLANSVALAIDSTLQNLYKHVPWQVTATSSLAVADVVGVRKVLASNGVPMDANLHLMLSPTLEAEALLLPAFTQWSGAGAPGAEAQITGTLGMRFGFETFMSQSVKTHVPGVGTDVAGAVSTQIEKGDTSIVIKSLEASGTYTAGDYITIAGNTQQYAITTATSASGGVATFTIDPPAAQQYLVDAVVGVVYKAGEISLGFHSDAFGLVMGALPAPQGIGANADIYTAQDPSSGLSLRVRRWYDPNTAAHKLFLDALWGVVCLNPNMACRLVD